MASAKSEGENLSRLQCGGQFFRLSYFRQPSPVPKFFYFFLTSPTLSKGTVTCPRAETLLVGSPSFFYFLILFPFFILSCPVEKLKGLDCQTLLCCCGEFVGLHEGHCCQSSHAREFHPCVLTGRVEHWRTNLSNRVSSTRLVKRSMRI